MFTRRIIKGIALGMTLSLSVLTAGCFGKFQLTRMIYDLNKSVEDKYLRSALTWALIFPYGFSTFIDFAVFNVVEFWTGENPLMVTRVHTEGADTVAMTLSREGKGTVAVLDRFRDGKRQSTLVIRDAGDGVVRSSLFENGREVRNAIARLNADGSVSVDGMAGGVAFGERHAPSDVSAVRARIEAVLARISHHPATAAADTGISTALRSIVLLDVVSTTPASPSRRAPCIHARLHPLVTQRGEKCGLAHAPGVRS